MSQEQEQEQKQGQAKADMQAPEKGPIRRFLGKKWVRRLLWILFICHFLFSCARQCSNEKTESDSVDREALQDAVLRAVFMQEVEYEIVPTEDKWYKLGNRPFNKSDIDYCQIKPGRGIYADLPDGSESPAMIYNCVIARVKLTEYSYLREWLRYFLPFLEEILPFEARYHAYVPAEYLGDEALYNRIVSALQTPCKYAYKGKGWETNSFDSCLGRFCKYSSPVTVELRILKHGVKKYQPGTEVLFSKTIKQLP